jgi:hypothetical protein
MKNLLDQVLETHGGLNHFAKFDKVYVEMIVGGVLWTVKGHPDIVTNSKFAIDLKKQHGGYLDFDNKAGLSTVFSAERVSLQSDGTVLEELVNPRDSFNGHTLETKWNKLQLAYFGSYAMWSYLTTPFLFTYPGFLSKEIESWHEAGETWRRLHVTYPGSMAYHSKEQVLYFDKHGFLKRLDYDVEIMGGTTAAHYVFDYKEFQGIMVPTRRLVYPRDDNGNYISTPLVVDVELIDVKFT